MPISPDEIEQRAKRNWTAEEQARHDELDKKLDNKGLSDVELEEYKRLLEKYWRDVQSDDQPTTHPESGTRGK